MHPLTAAQARNLDRFAMTDVGIPGVALMENAGRNVAHLLASLGPRRVLILCGKGNNGGDGFVVARHLDVIGVPAHTVLFADPAALAGDAAVNFAALRKCGLSHDAMPLFDEARLLELFKSADWLVDALFGSGLAGPIRPPFDRIIALMNASGKPTLAIDVPSGLDADTGQPLGVAVRASHTATVVAPKVGFAQPGATEYLGEVHAIDMGLPPRLVSDFLSASALAQKDGSG